MKTTKLIYENYPYPNKLDLEKRKQVEGWLDKLFLYHFKFDLHNLKNKIILDAGCGTGEKSFYLSKYAKKVIAVDQSNNSIQIARKRYKTNNILFKNISIESLKKYYNTPTFDFIFSYGVLHHTEDAHNNFNLLCDLLKPKGYIYINVYSKYGFFFRKYDYWNKYINFVARDDKKRAKIAISLFKKDKLKEKFGNEPNAYAMDCYGTYYSKHSIVEILNWFKENNIRYVASFPNRFGENNNFTKRLLNQFEQLLRPYVKPNIDILGIKSIT